MDYEMQYSMTSDYVNHIFESNKNILDIYRACVLIRVTTCTLMYQDYWHSWDKTEKDLRVREIPKDAQRTCCLVDIRTQESYNRWPAIY